MKKARAGAQTRHEHKEHELRGNLSRTKHADREQPGRRHSRRPSARENRSTCVPSPHAFSHRTLLLVAAALRNLCMCRVGARVVRATGGTALLLRTQMTLTLILQRYDLLSVAAESELPPPKAMLSRQQRRQQDQVKKHSLLRTASQHIALALLSLHCASA